MELKATLTKSSPISSDFRKRPGRSIVYVNSVLDKAADEFGTKYDVWNLPFKSKTWSSVCRVINKATAELLRQLFPDAVSIKFSAKAGCSCGCSPGYIVKKNDYVVGSNHWVDIEASQEEYDEFLTQVFSHKHRTGIQKEKEAYLKQKETQEAVA